MQAIMVKYLSATDTKPARMKAKCEAGNVTLLSYKHSVSSEQNAANAAIALCKKLGWTGEFYGDLIAGYVNDHWVFVFTTNTKYSLST